jgi:hypothetical protein
MTGVENAFYIMSQPSEVFIFKLSEVIPVYFADVRPIDEVTYEGYTLDKSAYPCTFEGIYNPTQFFRVDWRFIGV